jgi:hypothetical protein
MTALENARLCVREKDSNAIVRVNKYRSEREGIELFSVTMQTPCLWNRKQGPGGEVAEGTTTLSVKPFQPQSRAE